MGTFGLNFRFAVRGVPQLQFALRNIPIRDWSEWFATKAAAILRGMWAEQFETQGARGPHGHWADLTEEYAARKAKKYPGQGILRASDRLYDALTGQTGDSVLEVWPTRMRIGTTLPYALFDQLGYRAGHQGKFGRLGRITDIIFGVEEKGPTDVPARMIFDMRMPQDARSLERSAGTWFATKCRRLGFRLRKEGRVEFEAGDAAAARLAGLAEYRAMAAYAPEEGALGWAELGVS